MIVIMVTVVVIVLLDQTVLHYLCNVHHFL